MPGFASPLDCYTTQLAKADDTADTWGIDLGRILSKLLLLSLVQT